MPRYIIERQFLLPVYEHLLITAPNFKAACREALDDIANPWSEDAQQDFDNAGPVTITEAVELPEETFADLQEEEEMDRRALAQLLYNSGSEPLPIPEEFRANGTNFGFS
jgi:hypothetical protein